MKTTYQERQRQRLLKLQRELGQRTLALAGAIQQREVPPGEHERRIVPSDGGEADVITEDIEVRMAVQIQEALDRMESGTYGFCQGCGQPIAKARLDALPFAAHCIRCERELESS